MGDVINLFGDEKSKSDNEELKEVLLSSIGEFNLRISKYLNDKHGHSYQTFLDVCSIDITRSCGVIENMQISLNIMSDNLTLNPDKEDVDHKENK